MKLRLLNGTHTALAALAEGHGTVAEAIADPELEGFIRRLLDEELIPTVPAELDPRGYAKTMLERFATRASSTGSSRSPPAPSTRSPSGCCPRPMSCGPRDASQC